MSRGPFAAGAEVSVVLQSAATLTDGDALAAAVAYWRSALEGVDLGDYDRLIAAWAERAFDASTILVLADLLERAREHGEYLARHTFVGEPS